VTEPAALWDHFKDNICFDLIRQLERWENPPDIKGHHVDYRLYLIDLKLQEFHKTLDDFHMPRFTGPWSGYMDHNKAIVARLEAAGEPAEITKRLRSQLNTDQRRCYDQVLAAVESGEPAGFFIQGAGGTGKTFLYRALFYELRARGKVVICVASSRIASLLLPYGRTAHSMFNIPL
jgi:DNA replication protein DnaC